MKGARADMLCDWSERLWGDRRFYVVVVVVVVVVGMSVMFGVLID